MSTPGPEYDFRPLTEEDLPLVRRWLLEPHVSRWWDDDPAATYPDDELAEYRERIHGRGDPTDHFLIRYDGLPLGLIQSYRIDDDAAYADALALDAPAVGIDVFIGEPDQIGHGHGARLLRAFLRDIVFARYDVDECVIGPSVRNASAVRAYEKAGFRFLKDVHVPDEAEPERLLRIRRDEL